jgi:hypothetical protein
VDPHGWTLGQTHCSQPRPTLFANGDICSDVRRVQTTRFNVRVDDDAAAGTPHILAVHDNKQRRVNVEEIVAIPKHVRVFESKPVSHVAFVHLVYDTYGHVVVVAYVNVRSVGLMSLIKTLTWCRGSKCQMVQR